MQDNARTIDGDVSELMEEISRGKRAIDETHTTPTNQFEPVADELLLHSIPDKQSEGLEGTEQESPVLPEKEESGKADE